MAIPGSPRSEIGHGGRLPWVAVKELKLSYHNIGIWSITWFWDLLTEFK